MTPRRSSTQRRRTRRKYKLAARMPRPAPSPVPTPGGKTSAQSFPINHPQAKPAPAATRQAMRSCFQDVRFMNLLSTGADGPERSLKPLPCVQSSMAKRQYGRSPGHRFNHRTIGRMADVGMPVLRDLADDGLVGQADDQRVLVVVVSGLHGNNSQWCIRVFTITASSSTTAAQSRLSDRSGASSQAQR